MLGNVVSERFLFNKTFFLIWIIHGINEKTFKQQIATHPCWPFVPIFENNCQIWSDHFDKIVTSLIINLFKHNRSSLRWFWSIHKTQYHNVRCVASKIPEIFWLQNYSTRNRHFMPKTRENRHFLVDLHSWTLASRWQIYHFGKLAIE